jgi:hypothetical protein
VLTFNYTIENLSATRYSKAKLATESFTSAFVDDKIYNSLPYAEISAIN